MQLCDNYAIPGQRSNVLSQYSNLTKHIFLFQVELNTYGIDFDGPVSSDYEFESVEVPEIETNVPQHCTELIADHQGNDIDSYVKLYMEVLRILIE